MKDSQQNGQSSFSRTGKKAIVDILYALFLVMLASPSFAQNSKEQAKERKVIMKSSMSELTQKATKIARKEAKKLRKEGWTTASGSLPIEKQLEKSG